MRKSGTTEEGGMDKGIEDQFYAQAARELREDEPDLSCMARATEKAEGDAKRTKSLYITFRVEQLARELEVAKQREAEKRQTEAQREAERRSFIAQQKAKKVRIHAKRWEQEQRHSRHDLKSIVEQQPTSELDIALVVVVGVLVLVLLLAGLLYLLSRLSG